MASNLITTTLSSVSRALFFGKSSPINCFVPVVDQSNNAGPSCVTFSFKESNNSRTNEPLTIRYWLLVFPSKRLICRTSRRVMQSISKVSWINAWNKAFTKTRHYTFEKVIMVFTVVDSFTISTCFWLVQVVRKVFRITRMMFQIFSFFLPK